MSDQYLLECECGKQLSVGARQAGQSVRCGCGNTIGVPSLRDLRRLPVAHRGDRRKSTAWSQTQGFTFVMGSIVTAIALCVFFYILTARRHVEVSASPFDRFLDRCFKMNNSRRHCSTSCLDLTLMFLPQCDTLNQNALKGRLCSC